MSPQEIIAQAIKTHKPVKILLMVSGGHDSITNAHISAEILTKLGYPFEVYHGDTTIGIPETQEYVNMICRLYNWKLNIRKPPNKEDWYDNIVAKYGFPGRNKSSHRYMYIRLKERALRHFVTHECKTSPYRRENVLLLSGVRRDESIIRMGYKEVITKEDSRVWATPIFFKSEKFCNDYMSLHNIPLNPVKVAICISGECLCGCWAAKEEKAEIRAIFPKVGERLDQLEKVAADNGFPWGWGQGPNEWKKEQAEKAQMKLNFLCVGCEKKRQIV